MGYGPSTATALLLTVGGLVGLLRDNHLDPAAAQVGAVAAGGVRLVGSDGVGPGARPPQRAADLAAVHHLLWRHDLHTDLTQPLQATAVLRGTA